MSLRIVRLAAGSAFQDRGRPGWRRYGVPPGGAFDRESYELALHLVGRNEGEALEIPIPGGEFVALESDRLSLVGEGLVGELDGAAIPVKSAFEVTAGARLLLKPAATGLRAYLASARGWKVKPVLESVSGVVPGLEFESADLPFRFSKSPDSASTSSRDDPIRIVRGPQGRESDLDRIQMTEFKVSLQSNRVGIRLMGGEFEAAEEFPSESSCIGAIQLAPSGELLIHGPDGPTVAGYPTIAVVIQADLSRLGQLRPLQDVRFETVPLAKARELATSFPTESK